MHARAAASLAQAFGLLEPALAAARRRYGPRSPLAMELADRVGWALFESERYTEAEPVYRALMEDGRRMGDARRTLQAQRSLAATLSNMDRLEEAERECAGALAGIEERAGLDHRQTLIAVNIMGTIAEGRGDLARAEALYARVAEGQRAIDPGSNAARFAAVNRARVRMLLGMLTPAEALAALEDGLRLAETNPRPTQRHRLRLAYGRCLLRLGRVDEAASFIREAAEQVRALVPAGHRWAVEAESLLNELSSAGR